MRERGHPPGGLEYYTIWYPIGKTHYKKARAMIEISALEISL